MFTSFLENWGYLAVFVLSFISSMGLPVGAEVAIIFGGVLASGHVPHEPHHLDLALVIVVAVLAEVLGSLTGYLIGYYGGRTLVDRVGKYVLLTHRDLDPLLRSFVSFAAGLGEMAVGKFLLFTVIGCAVWCTALTSLGYSLGATYNHVLKGFSDAGYVAAALFVVAVVILFVHRFRVIRSEQGGRRGA